MDLAKRRITIKKVEIKDLQGNIPSKMTRNVKEVDGRESETTSDSAAEGDDQTRELSYYDQKIRRDTNFLVEQSAMSRMTMFKRRQTKVPRPEKESISAIILPIIKEDLESEKADAPVVKVETPKAKKSHPWSREGLVALYEQGLNVGKGLSQPPHIIPYRFLGTPDLKRDDSLLPKIFQFAKRMSFPTLEDHKKIKVPRVEGEPMVLPLTLKAACWNGERWEGTAQTSSEAKRSNGFKALYSEVVNSQKRLILCKTGQYFLKGHFDIPNEGLQDHPLSLSDDDESERNYDQDLLQIPSSICAGELGENPEGGLSSRSREPKKRRSFVSEIPLRQHKHTPSVAKPFIPPLPLKSLPHFEQAEELEHNEEILSAFRQESSRYATARLASPSDRTEQDNQVLSSGRTISGLPLKACGQTSLRQLGHILSTNTSFRAIQNRYNGKLMQSLRNIQTSRPYHFAREFGMKHKGQWDPKGGTPHRAATFRRHLARFGWFEELLEMTFSKGRRPSKAEVFVIEDIRQILDRGETYCPRNFTDLFISMRHRRIDLENLNVQKALLHVQNALKITDLELLTDLMLNKSQLPSWLESKTSIVKQAIRDLSPHRFPMINWVDQETKKKAPVRNLRKLYWMKDKFASLRQSRASLTAMGEEESPFSRRDSKSRVLVPMIPQ